MLELSDWMRGIIIFSLVKVGNRLREPTYNLFASLTMGNILLFLATTFDDLP